MLINYVAERIPPIRKQTFEHLRPNLTLIKYLAELTVCLSKQSQPIARNLDKLNTFEENMHKFMDDWLNSLSRKAFTYPQLKLLIKHQKEFFEILSAFGHSSPYSESELGNLKKTFKKKFQDLRKAVTIETKKSQM